MELVEDKIIAEIQLTTCGAAVYDEWSRYGVYSLFFFLVISLITSHNIV